MEILKEALIQTGFEFVKNCRTCGGLGFIYKRDRVDARLKISADRNREVNIQIGRIENKNSYTIQGRIIPPTLINRQYYSTVEEVINVINDLIGLNVKEETTD